MAHYVTIGTSNGESRRFWAQCETCRHLGPVRATWNEAQDDQELHLRATEEEVTNR